MNASRHEGEVNASHRQHSQTMDEGDVNASLDPEHGGVLEAIGRNSIYRMRLRDIRDWVVRRCFHETHR